MVAASWPITGLWCVSSPTGCTSSRSCSAGNSTSLTPVSRASTTTHIIMLAAITPSSSRDGDRHGEDVVHQQCTRDGESGLLAEVLGCHLVVPAARRVGVDVLAVRGDDHPEHHHHREGDPRRDRDGRETGERERQEDQGRTPRTRAPPTRSRPWRTPLILLTLAFAGFAAVAISPWVALTVVVVLGVVVAAYRQNVHANPSGGGDYEVASENLGKKAGLAVASALLVDYILTVAVSISAAARRDRGEHDDVRGRAGATHRRQAGGVPGGTAPSGRAARGRGVSPEPGDRPTRRDHLRGRPDPLLPRDGGDGAHPRPRRQHGVQRFPRPGFDPGPGRVPAASAAHTRRPACLLQRHRDADSRRVCA